MSRSNTRRRGLLAIAFVAASAPVAAAQQDLSDRYASHVVALDVSHQSWDEDRPWSKLEPGSRSAMAVVVEGNRLLVTAQAVWDSTVIGVTKRGTSERATARIAHLDESANLALLDVVDDPDFFDDLRPVKLRASMPVSGPAPVVRWVDRQLQVAPSSVDRIGVAANICGMRHAFLMLRNVDGGGWASPVFVGEELAGLVVTFSDGRSSAIPSDMIARYLEMARTPDAYAGFAGIDMYWQLDRHRAQAQYLGVEGRARGIVVTQLVAGRTPWSTGADGVQPRDVLVSIDGHAIDSDGYYDHPRYGRLAFHHIVVDGHVAGDRVPVEVLRGGKEMQIEIELRRWRTADSLMPWRRPTTPPPYAVFGGLVFRELDGEFLRTWGDWRHNAPPDLSARFHGEQIATALGDERVILVSSVLADAYNIGYHDVRDLVVQSINGRRVDSIGDVVEAFAAPEGGFHTVSFAPNPMRGEVVLDAAGLAAAQERIAEGYGVPAMVRVPGGK